LLEGYDAKKTFFRLLYLSSPRHFALAFKMFDLNGDGELDYQEFEKVCRYFAFVLSFPLPLLKNLPLFCLF